MQEKDFLHKDRLISEALKEFADKGFDSASLNQIIKRSGISKGSFYYHFNNKEELFYSVIHRAAQEKLAFITQWIEDNGLSDQPRGFFETLDLQMAGGIEFAVQRPELSVFLMNVMQNPELKAKALALAPPYYDQAFDTILEQARLKGELRSDMDLEFTKKLLRYSLLNMGELLLDSMGEDLDREELTHLTSQYVKFLQSGLGVPGRE